MSRLPIFLAAIFVAAPGSANQADGGDARIVEIRLSNFAFTPRAIHLRAGEPVILRLVNTAAGGHDFSAAGFFAAAEVRLKDRPAINKGTVELRGETVQDIAVTPHAGRYQFRCKHTFHTTFGMSGEIIVDLPLENGR